jgi:hypothetical protein
MHVLCPPGQALLRRNRLVVSMHGNLNGLPLQAEWIRVSGPGGEVAGITNKTGRHASWKMSNKTVVRPNYLQSNTIYSGSQRFGP